MGVVALFKTVVCALSPSLAIPPVFSFLSVPHAEPAVTQQVTRTRARGSGKRMKGSSLCFVLGNQKLRTDSPPRRGVRWAGRHTPSRELTPAKRVVTTRLVTKVVLRKKVPTDHARIRTKKRGNVTWKLRVLIIPSVAVAQLPVLCLAPRVNFSFRRQGEAVLPS